MIIYNITGYKFIELTDLVNLKVFFKKRCIDNKLKGTILLSEEGVNINLAGQKSGIDKFQMQLKSELLFSDIPFKETQSTEVPFRKLFVKIKKEIITLGKGRFQHQSDSAHTIKPLQLKQWLDEGKDVILLDTRNLNETKIGSFENAKILDIQSFTQFPDAVLRTQLQNEERPIVMFCTGGVRCEKVLPWMLENGFNQLYQLEGGIIKYFQECGGQHYSGECFVFDDRIAIDPELKVTGTCLCSACQMPMTPSEQANANFTETQKCLNCT